MKIKKSKFIRNIIISIVALLIVAFIVNIAPGYKRNKYQNVINLIIGDENVTEKLINKLYIDENEIVYISKEDIQELLDKTAYYNPDEQNLILTSDVAVASMKLGEKIMNINGSTVDMLDMMIYQDDIIYVPINELEIVYNIEIEFLKDKNIVIIDKLNEGMIRAEACKQTTIRFKARSLSKEVGQLEEGDIVSAFYTTSKGWRLIRTEKGIIGYVKANTLTNEYIVRQDMKQTTETKTISINTQDNTALTIDENKILIKDLITLTDEEILLKNSGFTNNDENTKIWANMTIQNIDLTSYDNRAKFIKNVVSIVMKNDINGVNIYLEENDEKNLERFIIELAPRLREIGIITNIIADGNIDEEKYIDIVSYIIKK